MAERNSFNDLETRSPVPIKHGTHAYAEQAEVLLWAYAGDEGEPRVWDVINGTDNYLCELSDLWVEVKSRQGVPDALLAMLDDPEVLAWFHNGGMFDFVVIDKVMPWVGARIPMSRRRDTMVQAYAHSLPGALDKLGEILKLYDDDRKLKDEGRKYIRLFCIPKEDGTYNDKSSHPKEWAGFIRYAARDITTMRAAHRKMPKWNYRTGKQVDLWHEDLLINSRGVFVDQELATKAIEAADNAKRHMAKRVREITEDSVESATKRDQLLAWILESHGVELPDMRADTLERRMDDPNLPLEVKELLGIRLRASMNSPAKYASLLRCVSSDGRLRGGAQFRGAGRTGRWAHRLFHWGNLPRPAYPYPFIEAGIAAIKAGCLDLVVDNEMEMCASAVRGCVIAPPGRKLIVCDLANGEGRVAAWIAGEDWKLQAFRDYDTIIPGFDAEGNPNRKGPDLYVKTYMRSFNVLDASLVTKAMRQIGKVEELMFQFGGGVGAWITGAATYGINLVAMTEAVYPTLPTDVIAEAENFLQWLYDMEIAKIKSAIAKNEKAFKDGKISAETLNERSIALEAEAPARLIKVRFGLDEKVFVTCDSLKRLWRAAQPRIESIWSELEDAIREVIATPSVTLTVRRVKIRRDGSWLRIGLPSGRQLCYPNIHMTKAGEIAYTGQNTYTRQWGEVTTYGGKVFENIVQAVQCDVFAEVMPLAREAGYELCAGIHDEWIAEADDDDTFTAQGLAEIMCADLGWNAGLPLAAAGEEMNRYHKT